MNNGGGDAIGCFEIKVGWDSAKFSNTRIAGLGKRRYLVRESEMFVKDITKIASRVRGQFCILASCCLSPLRRNAVLEEWKVSRCRLLVIQDPGVSCCRAFWR